MIIKRERSPLAIILLAVLLVVIACVSLTFGQIDVPVGKALAVIGSQLNLPGFTDADYSREQLAVIWYIRLPRMLVGVLVGAALGISGAVMQGIFNGLHDSFLFDKEELGELFDSGISYMELKKLCLHAYAAKKPVREVAQLRDKYVWTRVDYLLGLTPEKLARAEHEYKVDRIHRLFGLDKKLVDKYMRMGYASHQVKRAMFLARHCDKSVEELLAMKTRQQKWGDICEQLGLPRDACMK